MTSTIEFIQNRYNQKIRVLVNRVENQKGLVFIQHGLGGFAGQKHIEAFAKTFVSLGYTAIRFDTTHSIGESDGDVRYVTITQSVTDLEDVIVWAGSQPWYVEPFMLCGHSLGSFSIMHYAAQFPEKVLAIVPTSCFIGGVLYREYFDEETLEAWKQTGVREWESHSKPGTMVRVDWGFMQGAEENHLKDFVEKITAPVLLITGSEDTGTPAKHQQQYIVDVLGPKGVDVTLEIVPGSGHTYRTQEEFGIVDGLMRSWLSKRF